jgi:hypothetical protein
MPPALWRQPPLFGLAPGGVYRAADVTVSAVRSYRTVSPLPAKSVGGLFSVALSLGSPPPVVSRHRIPVEPGLSSDSSRTFYPEGSAAVRPSGAAEMRTCTAPVKWRPDPNEP